MFGIQIAGGNERLMASCAAVLEQECSVDFIDLNLGCPLDLVCNKGAGSALMVRPRKLEKVVRAMAANVTVPVGLKIRTGWSNGDPTAHKLLPMARFYINIPV